jgi:transcription initiation factor TFIIIB Brf1 subunit/transcription initiation factor TFIIB
MTEVLANICEQIGSFNAIVHPVEKVNPSNLFLSADYDLESFKSDIKSNVEDSLYRRPSSKRKIPKCEGCGIEMYKSSLEYICEECGRIREIVGGDVDIAEHGGTEGINDYNTSSNSAAPVRISGPHSYTYQKKLIRSTSNYKKQQKRNTRDQINSIMHQYKGLKLPINIIEQSSDLYYLVQQFCIKRGDVRRGTMAACVYRICKNNGLTRKPKEISEIFGIPQDELSNGEKILDELYANGSLGTTNETLADASNYNPSSKVNQFYFRENEDRDSFLSRYFELLNIPDTYMIFTQDLIKFTVKYKIAESSIMSSKCAGTIYILAMKIPELEIKRDDIERSCSISKSTFSRFSQAVFNMMGSEDVKYKKVRSRMRHLFKKHCIPIY